MNLFVLFGDGVITRKKIMETLHHDLAAKSVLNSYINLVHSFSKILYK
jgi:hypothetical protein